MKVITTTHARKRMKELIDRARHHGEVFAIGRRKQIDAVLIGFPVAYNDAANDITNINAYSKSFDFLSLEPELYSVDDVRKRYA